MKNTMRYFLCGAAMGAADVVPGVSGGTIAFISGIYGELLNAIQAFDLEFFKNLLRLRLRGAFSRIPWGFLLPLLAGVAISIFSLARIVLFVLHTWPVVIWSFFFGLILASIVLLMGEMNWKRGGTYVAFLAGIVFAWNISGAPTISLGHSLPIYFIAGFIAICAMILPGISGAFILVLLGQYEAVIRAIAQLDFGVIIIFAAGCALGLMTFARLLNALLRRYPHILMAVLTGIMLGALRAVWPWKMDNYPSLPPAWDMDVVVAVILCAFGAALLLGFNALPQWLEKKQRQHAGS